MESCSQISMVVAAFLFPFSTSGFMICIGQCYCVPVLQIALKSIDDDQVMAFCSSVKMVAAAVIFFIGHTSGFAIFALKMSFCSFDYTSPTSNHS